MTSARDVAKAKSFSPLKMEYGFRHYLQGDPIQCGTVLEMQADTDTKPVEVRYETTYAGPSDQRRQVAILCIVVSHVEFSARVADHMRFRWPGRWQKLEEYRKREEEDRARRKRQKLIAKQNLRIHPERGPVLLGLDSFHGLAVLDQRGRWSFVRDWEVESWKVAAGFDLPIGPHVPPADRETCWCHRLPHAQCPSARPCIGDCGRRTTYGESSAAGYCRFCHRSEVTFKVPPQPRARMAADVLAFRERAHRKLGREAA